MKFNTIILFLAMFMVGFCFSITTAGAVDNPKFVELVVNVVGDGSVEPGSGMYPFGSMVILVATPRPSTGAVFLGWGGDAPPDAGTATRIGIIMSRNKTVTATFTVANSYSLETIVSGNGAVLVNPIGPNYAPGAQVTVEAIPAPGNFFVGWTPRLVGNPATITMDLNKTVTANFQTFVGVLYYSHIACQNAWETEVCAINTGKETIAGEFTAYNEVGTIVGSFGTVLSPFERVVVDVDTSFINTDNIRYIIFNATYPSNTVVGYTRFYQAGLCSAALPAVRVDQASVEGVLCRLDSGGTAWTGISVVNTSDMQTNVIFKALNDNGSEVGTMSISLNSYEKWAGLPEDLFKDDITGATYVIYQSEMPVVVFQLNGEGSGAKKMLDGMPSQVFNSAPSTPFD